MACKTPSAKRRIQELAAHSCCSSTAALQNITTALQGAKSATGVRWPLFHMLPQQHGRAAFIQTSGLFGCRTPICNTPDRMPMHILRRIPMRMARVDTRTKQRVRDPTLRRASSSSPLYRSASCTMRSISSLLRRPLSLVIVILLFLPAPHRPTLTQHVHACMRHIRQSHCVTPHLRLLALGVLLRAKTLL